MQDCVTYFLASVVLWNCRVRFYGLPLNLTSLMPAKVVPHRWCCHILLSLGMEACLLDTSFWSSWWLNLQNHFLGQLVSRWEPFFQHSQFRLLLSNNLHFYKLKHLVGGVLPWGHLSYSSIILLFFHYSPSPSHTTFVLFPFVFEILTHGPWPVSCLLWVLRFKYISKELKQASIWVRTYRDCSSGSGFLTQDDYFHLLTCEFHNSISLFNYIIIYIGYMNHIFIIRSSIWQTIRLFLLLCCCW